ncbi:MAG: pyridoxal-phosphate dependent enzyme [Deltaproteobacteria bacterium]|nr:pyridoxal-phosphate dependent enzyme [Deltaproteobacteria bacterium]
MTRLHLSTTVAGAQCSKTGAPVSITRARPWGRCSCCDNGGLPIMLRYQVPDGAWYVPSRHGLRRYEPLLPVSGMDAAYADDVGGTATVLHEGLSDRLDVEVWIKNESTNPSGSFKDRGLAIGVALGAALGARRFCLPTQGNAGVAAALFSARLGLEPCLVAMPAGYRNSVYHRAAELFGAEVTFHGANIGETGKQLRAALADPLAAGSIVDISTFFEPGRLEGKKTLGLEIFEATGADRLPTHIFYPTGGGTGLVGIYKAFEELAELGALDRNQHRLPKMIAVQAERCAPIVKAWAARATAVDPISSQQTIADGLDVPAAIMGHEILATLRRSDGNAVTVSDQAIRENYQVSNRLGVNVGLEGAAALAAVEKLRANRALRADDRVLVLLTGGHFVALDRLAQA